MIQKILPLIIEKFKSHKSQKKSYIHSKFEHFWKIKYHCHFTGTHKGAPHSICNFRYAIPEEIPIIMHNGSHYYLHLVVKNLSKIFKNCDLDYLEEDTKNSWVFLF